MLALAEIQVANIRSGLFDHLRRNLTFHKENFHLNSLKSELFKKFFDIFRKNFRNRRYSLMTMVSLFQASIEF